MADAALMAQAERRSSSETSSLPRGSSAAKRDESTPASVSGSKSQKSPSKQNRVHFTPEPGDKAPADSLQQPIPPRRPSQPASASYTPTSYTPVSASPALVQTPSNQHYEAPSHHGPSKVPNNADMEMLERAMSGATWDHPANIRLRVVSDFEPCCSVELRAYQDQLITGLFQNGAWVYVRASNGAEGYLPTASCSLSQDRPPSNDISSSGVSSVGTAEDDVSNSGRSYSSLERNSTERGGSVSSTTSPDGRTSGYSSEPEKSANRVKFAPTASILQPGYRSVHIPEDYVALYRQRPRTATVSGGWQSHYNQRSHGNSAGPGSHQQQQPLGGVPEVEHVFGPGEITRARNMSHPQGRVHPGPAPIGPTSSAQSFSTGQLPYETVQAPGPQAGQSSRSRRLIDRLKNFRSGAAPASVDVFEVDGSSVPPRPGHVSREPKKDSKKKKQSKKSARHKEFVTSDTEVTNSHSRKLAAPLGRSRNGGRESALTDTEIDRDMSRLDLASMSSGSGVRGSSALHSRRAGAMAFQQFGYQPSHRVTNDPLLANARSRNSVATSRPSQMQSEIADDNDVMMVTSFVLYDFEAQQEEQLSVKRGQPVWKIYAANDVIKAGEVGWIFVMDPESKQKGFIPQACLQPLPSQGSLAVSRGLGTQGNYHNG